MTRSRGNKNRFCYAGVTLRFDVLIYTIIISLFSLLFPLIPSLFHLLPTTSLNIAWAPGKSFVFSRAQIRLGHTGYLLYHQYCFFLVLHNAGLFSSMFHKLYCISEMHTVKRTTHLFALLTTVSVKLT